VITAVVDTTRTGKITQYEEDQTMGMMGGILGSTAVLEKTATLASEHGIETSASSLFTAVSVERYSYRWVMRLRDPDPQRASMLAGYWLEAGKEALENASAHAEKAETLRRQLEGLENCFSQIAAVSPVYVPCGYQNQADLQREMKNLADVFWQEKLASSGVIPALGFNVAEEPAPAMAPVRRGQNILALAGALIGLAVAIVLVGSGALVRWSQKRNDR